MRSSLRNLALLGAALVAAAGVGCGSRKSGGGASEGVFRYALQSRPTTLDPALVEDGDTIDMLQQVFGGLVQWSPTNEIVPNIAKDWDLSADGRTYTFHLRTDVKFHAPISRPVTAQDVVYSITRALLPATKSPTAKSYLYDIVGAADVLEHNAKTLSGLKAIDDHTLALTIDKRKPYFLGKLTYPTAYVVCREAIERNNGVVDEKAMVGTGPFMLKEYRLGYAVSLVANQSYYGGVPKLKGIERPILADSNSRQTRYESGGLDLVDVQRADLPRVKQDPVLSKQLREFARANIWYLALNQKAYAPFKDKRVRQAFAMSIDKDALIKMALQGTATRATNIVPPGVPGRNDAATGLPYDPAKARELLAQAGFAGGKGLPKLTISFRQGYKYIEDCVLSIRGDLKRNLGIEVDVQQIEWAQFLTLRGNGSLPCFFLRWSADYLDPQNFLSLMLRTGSVENAIGYSNPQFDKLCDQADVEPNNATRMKLYAQAEAIALDDAPWAPCFYLRDVELVKPNVRELKDSLMGHQPHLKTELARP